MRLRGGPPFDRTPNSLSPGAEQTLRLLVSRSHSSFRLGFKGASARSVRDFAGRTQSPYPARDILRSIRKVRLDDDIRRGAFGLTTDRKDKTATRHRQGSGKRASRAAETHVANALRNAYEEAVSEDVPTEFLDLLGKLT